MSFFGVTETIELIKNKIEIVMQSCQFKKIKVYGISNMPFKYIENKKLSLLLPIYNFVDYLIDIIPWVKNTIGSFLITKARK